MLQKSKEEIIQHLYEIAPYKPSQEERTAILEKVEEEHNQLCRNEEHYYSSLPEMLAGIKYHHNKKFTLVEGKSYGNSLNGYHIVFKKPLAVFERELTDKLDTASAEYAWHCANKQKEWISEQLDIVLSKQAEQEKAEIEAKKKAKANELQELLFGLLS